MFANALEPAWKNPAFHFDRAAATHLLNRAGFGGTSAEIDQLVKLGPAGAVHHLVNFHTIEYASKPLEFGGLTHMQPRELRRYRQQLKHLPIDQRKAAMQLYFGARYAKLEEMRYWWLDRMVRSPRPLEEKMTLLWHGLFVSAMPAVGNVYHLYMQNELFRRMAVGNFKTLTLEVSKDPAMLKYLNNNVNKKQHPNENYARELMELFTLGIGNYTEEDVRQAARAWTGWSFFGDRFVRRPRWHDFGRKTFLGQTGNFDGTDIVDIIFQQPAASVHLATRLLKFFAVDEPPAQIVHALAASIKDHNFNVAPVLETLFSSSWFYSPQVVRHQVKSPVQLVAGALRQLDAPLPNAYFITQSSKLMGQMLFMAPNVKGWPFGRQWINTSTLFVRYNLPAYLVTGWLSPAAKKLARTSGESEVFQEFQNGWDAQFILARAGATAPAAIVDTLVDRLIQGPIAPAKRAELIQFLKHAAQPPGGPFDPTIRANQNQIRNLVHLIMSMPEYQLC